MQCVFRGEKAIAKLATIVEKEGGDKKEGRRVVHNWQGDCSLATHDYGSREQNSTQALS